MMQDRGPEEVRSARAGRTRLATIVIATALVILPWFLDSQYISGDALLYELDSAQLHYPRYRILCDALQHDHALPLWQNLVLAGDPFHANPENVTLYPPVVALALFASPLLVMNLTILLHLSAAALGAFLLVLRVWRRIAGDAAGPAPALGGALVAGLFAGLNFYFRRESLNLVGYGAAHALIPWILLAAEAMIHGPRPRRAAACLGLLAGFQVHTGGLYVFAYSAIGILLYVVLDAAPEPGPRRRLLRFGALAAVVALLVAAAKLLPYPGWVATTNRGDGLPYELARGVTLGGHDDFAWSQVATYLREFTGHWVGIVLAVIGLIGRPRRVLWAAAAVILLGLTIGLGGTVHHVLATYVPPFGSIRNAVRAWTLVNAFLPILIGVGACRVFAWLRAHPLARLGQRPGALALGASIGAAAVGALFAFNDSWRFNEMFAHPDSLRAVLERYPHLRAAAASGEDMRVAALKVYGPAQHCEQLASSALGLETVNGFLGHAWNPEMNRHAFHTPDGARLFGRTLDRRLGILSVRWMLSDFVVDRDSLDPELLASTYPKAIDGLSLQRNYFCRPRAFVPGRALLVLGDDAADTVTYTLLDTPTYNPMTSTILTPREDDTLGDAELGAINTVVVANSAAALPPVHAEMLARAVRRGIPTTHVTLPLADADRGVLEDLATATSRKAPAPIGAAFARVTSQRTRVLPEAGAAGKFVVVSEKWWLYPGFRLRYADGSATAHRADGMASAVFVPAEGLELHESYAPTDARIGLAAMIAGIVLGLGLAVFPPRARASVTLGARGTPA